MTSDSDNDPFGNLLVLSDLEGAGFFEEAEEYKRLTMLSGSKETDQKAVMTEMIEFFDAMLLKHKHDMPEKLVTKINHTKEKAKDAYWS
ncbi:MAG: hypothetical protein R3E13_09935 [Alphaproteobacteria bacterium]